jgi:Carbohydrate/starch-binding module (family 21)
MLSVEVLVKNLAFAKQVAIVYSLDNWLTFHNAFGGFQQSFPPATMPHQVQSELWKISVLLTPGASGKFAVFYIVDSTTYWDNNFSLNYSF